MIALYIIGGILLLNLLLLSLRVGVRVEFGDTLTVKAKIGPRTISVLPRAEKKRKEGGNKTPEGKQKAEKGKKFDLTAADIRSAMPAVWESLQQTFKKSRRKIRIDPLRVCVIFGGDDPAAVAEWYGWANNALWTVMPRLQSEVQIPDPQIHLGVDFSAAKTTARGEFGIWCRIGGLFAIGHAFGKPVIKWLLTNRKQKKTAGTKTGATGKKADNKAA